MLTSQRARDREAQAAALALGRDPWFEGARMQLGAQTRTGVADHELGPALTLAQLELDLRSGRGHVQGILNQVDHDLLDLSRVAAGLDLAAQDQRDAALAGQRLVQLDHVPDQATQLGVALAERDQGAREVEKFVEDRLHAIDLASEHAEPLERLAGLAPTAELAIDQRRQALDASQRVLELVGDLGRERGQLAGLLGPRGQGEVAGLQRLPDHLVDAAAGHAAHVRDHDHRQRHHARDRQREHRRLVGVPICEREDGRDQADAANLREGHSPERGDQGGHGEPGRAGAQHQRREKHHRQHDGQQRARDAAGGEEHRGLDYDDQHDLEPEQGTRGPLGQAIDRLVPDTAMHDHVGQRDRAQHRRDAEQDRASPRRRIIEPDQHRERGQHRQEETSSFDQAHERAGARSLVEFGQAWLFVAAHRSSDPARSLPRDRRGFLHRAKDRARLVPAAHCCAHPGLGPILARFGLETSDRRPRAHPRAGNPASLSVPPQPDLRSGRPRAAVPRSRARTRRSSKRRGARASRSARGTSCSSSARRGARASA